MKSQMISILFLSTVLFSFNVCPSEWWPEDREALEDLKDVDRKIDQAQRDMEQFNVAFVPEGLEKDFGKRYKLFSGILRILKKKRRIKRDIYWAKEMINLYGEDFSVEDYAAKDLPKGDDTSPKFISVKTYLEKVLKLLAPVVKKEKELDGKKRSLFRERERAWKKSEQGRKDAEKAALEKKRAAARVRAARQKAEDARLAQKKLEELKEAQRIAAERERKRAEEKQKRDELARQERLREKKRVELERAVERVRARQKAEQEKRQLEWLERERQKQLAHEQRMKKLREKILFLSLETLNNYLIRLEKLLKLPRKFGPEDFEHGFIDDLQVARIEDVVEDSEKAVFADGPVSYQGTMINNTNSGEFAVD